MKAGVSADTEHKDFTVEKVTANEDVSNKEQVQELINVGGAEEDPEVRIKTLKGILALLDKKNGSKDDTENIHKISETKDVENTVSYEVKLQTENAEEMPESDRDTKQVEVENTESISEIKQVESDRDTKQVEVENTESVSEIKQVDQPESDRDTKQVEVENTESISEIKQVAGPLQSQSELIENKVEKVDPPDKNNTSTVDLENKPPDDGSGANDVNKKKVSSLE